jgi:hypothetical protein
MPKRISYNRYKDGKLPINTVLITRPSRYCNPFTVREHGREKCLELYEFYLDTKIIKGLIDLNPLKGKDLACACKLEEKCHGDIILDRMKALGFNE